MTLPSRIRFFIVLLSALVTAAEVAMRMAEFAITVAVVVLLTVRFLLVPAELGLSPLMVTLSAPFNWITPKPVTGFPEIVRASPSGKIETEV